MDSIVLMIIWAVIALAILTGLGVVLRVTGVVMVPWWLLIITTVIVIAVVALFAFAFFSSLQYIG